MFTTARKIDILLVLNAFIKSNKVDRRKVNIQLIRQQ